MHLHLYRCTKQVYFGGKVELAEIRVVEAIVDLAVDVRKSVKDSRVVRSVTIDKVNVAERTSKQVSVLTTKSYLLEGVKADLEDLPLHEKLVGAVQRKIRRARAAGTLKMNGSISPR